MRHILIRFTEKSSKRATYACSCGFEGKASVQYSGRLRGLQQAVENNFKAHKTRAEQNENREPA